MKVLFLDIDGVMNTMKTPIRWTLPEYDGESRMVGMDQDKVFMLNKLIDRHPDIMVVLSSAWRIDPHWRETMRANGFIFAFLDRTPDYYGRTSRGTEIADWLMLSGADQDPTLRYAIIDDNADMLETQQTNFFKTDLMVGLTEEIIEKVENHLTS